eukprot:CAMPEP_0171362228 /NCGR_PEP_ID=MMETSP0879-20121228/2518_1 /TAXON_ID=67004 /ORGANISM="Thalassiosira weissflogii, Strain CCMP1336" /LENGTH=48 /DNA_ID= /DNA_START= /DNA_END= /DNA_ORIENTATION=
MKHMATSIPNNSKKSNKADQRGTSKTNAPLTVTPPAQQDMTEVNDPQM